MAMQRVTLVSVPDGRRTTRFYGPDELNAMWGFCAKMVFLMPLCYSAVTVETVDDETYNEWVKAKNEREAAADRARAAWSEFVKNEADGSL